MLKEMPKKGDLVRFVGEYLVDHLTKGENYNVEGVDSGGTAYILDNDGDRYYITEIYEFDEFELAESLRNERDLIVELAYNYAKLARKVDSLEDALQNVKHDAGQALADAATADEKAEMLIDDVVMLDERTRAPAAEEKKDARTKDDAFIEALRKSQRGMGK